jgi:lipopolysaccharide transport system ATP-binding protein
VSHNLPAVRSLCTSALILDQGRAGALASVADALAAYTHVSSGSSVSYRRTASAEDKPCLLSAHLITSSLGDVHETDSPLILELEIYAAGSPNPVANLHIFDAEQVEIIRSSSMLLRTAPAPGPVHKWRVILPARTLNVGEYRCTLKVAEYGVAVYEQMDFLLGFTVVDTAFPGPGEASGWVGYCSPKLLSWSVSR